MNRSLVLALPALLAALVLAAPAGARSAPSILAGGKGLGGIRAASDIYVDHAGGVDAVWGTGVNVQTLRFARRAKGHRAFGRAHPLPHPGGRQPQAYAAHIYEAHGELRVLFRSDDNTIPSEWIARSKNHGRSWRLTKLPVIDDPHNDFNPGDTAKYGFYTREQSTVAADGAISGLYGSNGAQDLYTIDAGLTRGGFVTPFETTSLADEWLLPAGGGRLWLSGRIDGGVGYRTPGGTTGTAAIPVCDNGSNVTVPGANAMAVGRGHAVLFGISECGRLYARTLSASGSVGGVRKLGAASTGLRTVSATYAGGRFRVAWVGADGDIHFATSATGSSWTVMKGAIPAAAVGPASTQQLYLDSRTGSWVIWGDTFPLESLRYAAASSAARVSAPRVSTRGIKHPKKGRLGTFALAGPSRLSIASLSAGHSFPVRIAAGAADTVTLDVQVNLKNFTLGLGQAVVHLRPGHPRLLHLKAAQPYQVKQYFRRGNPVTYSVMTRNGTLLVKGAKLVG